MEWLLKVSLGLDFVEVWFILMASEYPISSVEFIGAQAVVALRSFRTDHRRFGYAWGKYIGKRQSGGASSGHKWALQIKLRITTNVFQIHQSYHLVVLLHKLLTPKWDFPQKYVNSKQHDTLWDVCSDRPKLQQRASLEVLRVHNPSDSFPFELSDRKLIFSESKKRDFSSHTVLTIQIHETTMHCNFIFHLIPTILYFLCYRKEHWNALNQ